MSVSVGLTDKTRIMRCMSMRESVGVRSNIYGRNSRHTLYVTMSMSGLIGLMVTTRAMLSMSMSGSIGLMVKTRAMLSMSMSGSVGLMDKTRAIRYICLCVNRSALWIKLELYAPCL